METEWEHVSPWCTTPQVKETAPHEATECSEAAPLLQGGDSNGNLGEYGGVTRDGKHFDIHQFCELLNDHRSNSAECTGKDCVFFIGDTGAGKTLTIQYAAGCQTRFENFRVQDDFGETFERRLVVQDPLPGFVVGDSADSQTKFVQCHHTLRGLTLCDTPGFSDTQGRTVDAANAVAVMDAICGCRTVRIVLVVDTRQLDRKAGYIKSLLELLSVFLSDVHTVKGSVLAVFTHLDAGSDWRDLARKINKLKDARALDDADIRMFLDHLMHLLKTHQDHLIVRPAATDAAERRNSLFAILQQHVTALQCTEGETELFNLPLDPETKARSLIATRHIDPFQREGARSPSAERASFHDSFQVENETNYGSVKYSLALWWNCKQTMLKNAAEDSSVPLCSIGWPLKMSLELACADLRAGVEEHLRWSRPLDNLRQLRDLRLLSQILGDLAAVTRSYSEAVVVARTHVEGVLASAAQALQEHRFTCAAEDLRSLEGLESLYPHTEHDSAGAAMPVLQTKADCVTSQLHALAARLFDRAAHTETRFEEAAGALAPLRDVFERLAAHLTTEIRTRCSYDRAVRLLRERVLALAAASSALIHTEEGTEGGANAALGDPTALLPLDAQLCALRQSLHLAPHLGENLGARGQGVDCEALYQLAQRELDTALQCLAAASQLLGELEPRWSGPEASHATQRSILRAALEWLPALQRAVAALRAHLADSGGGADADLRRCLENRDRVAHHLIDALPAACEQEAWAEAAHCLVCIAVVVEMCPESDVQRQPLAERLLEARAQTVRRVDALAGRIHLRLEQGELGLALQGLRSLEVALERLEVEETLGRGGAETVARLEGERNSVRALLEQQASCALSGLAECVRRSGAAAAADAEECIKLSRASCLADRLRELERLVQAEVEHAVPGFEGRVLEVLQSLCGTLVQDCRECLAAVGALGKVVGGGEGGWKGSDAGGGSSSEPLPLSLLGARNHLQWLSDCVAELAPLVPTQDPETGRAPDDSRGESVGGGSPAPVASLHNITNKKKEKKRKKKTQARDEGNRAHGEAEAVAVAPPPCGTARSRPTELLPRLATMQIEVATNEGDPARCRAGSLPVHAHASWPSVLVSTIRAFQVAAEAELAALAMAQGRVAVECLHNDPPRISAVLGVSRVLQQLQCLDPLLGASPGCQQGSEGRHAEPSLMPLGAGAPERLAAPFAAQVEAVGAAVRGKLRELREACVEATRGDDLGCAENTLRLVEALLPLHDVCDAAMPVYDVYAELKREYDEKSGAFARRVHEGLDSADFEGLRRVLRGHEGLRSPAEARQHAEQVNIVREACTKRHDQAVQLLDTLRGVRGPLPPQALQTLATLLMWLEGAEALAEAVGEGLYDEWRARVRVKANNLLEALYARAEKSLAAGRCWQFVRAARERLEALEGDLEGILERCDYITLDRFFNGVSREFVLGGALDAAVDGAAQHDDGSGGWEEFEVGDRYPALLQALEQELLRRREAVTRHMQSHDIRQGCAELQWLRSIMRATIARSTLLGDELQELATLKDDVQGAMFEEAWLRKGEARDLAEKLRGFCEVDPMAYNRRMSAFLQQEVHAKMEGMLDILFGSKVETRVLLKVEDRLELLGRYASIFNEQAPGIEEARVRLRRGLLDLLDERYNRATCAIHAGEKQTVVHELGPLLKASIPLLRKLLQVWQPPGLEGTGVADDTNTGVSGTDRAEAKALLQMIEKFIKHTLDLDTSELSSRWRELVQGFALERPGLPVEELGTFLQHLKREKAFIERTMGLDEYISHQEAMGVIAKRLRSVGALAEAAWGKRSQEPRLGTLVTIIQNLEALREQDELREECASPCRELQEWLAARTRSLAEEAQRTYSEATRATQAVQHQALTSRVNELMESHAQLVQCVAEARVIGGSGAGSPHGCPLRESSLEHKINLRTSELAEEVMARMQRGEHALGGVTADEVAQRLLAIYGTAADLSDAGIKAHAMECIDKILTKCQTLELLEAVGLELGAHDLGNEVVGRMPHFEELRLAKFDEVTACMSASDTLRKLTALNSLSEERAAALKSLYNVFDARYKVLCRRLLVRRDLAGLAHEARTACSSRSVEGLAELIAAIFAIWSYSSAQPKAKTLKKPLPAQVLALFQLLDLSRSDTSIVSWICAKIGIAGGTQPRNHFAQIKTGQGKSLVLGVLATVLAVLGYSVDVVCYSQYLVDRDRAAFDQLFELFGVERLVRHGTFQALSQLIMNEDGDIRLSTKKLLTRDTDTSSTSAAASKGRSKAPAAHEKQRILLIDEVDVFFSSEFYGTTYDPIMHVQGDHVAAIQFFLWEHREKSAAELLRQLRTEKCTELAALTETMGGAMGVVDGQLDLMVRDLKALLAPGGAESYPYSIKDGRIAYRVQDTVATDVSFGYATMWSYLVEHGRGRVNDTTLQQSLGLRVSCGQLSYAEIPKRYDTILGVTGTLVPESPSSQHPLGAFEQAILEKEYGIVHKTEMPSIFGESQLTFRERNDVHVEMDEAQYNRRIKEEIVESTARGRAVLVFFESEAALQRWRVTEYCTSTAAGLVEVVTAATSNIDHYITRATRSGCATLLSREHGRGLDFVCHDRTVEREGGVHVVQTFLSEVVSEELQIRGRTARQEKKGTFKLVLHAKSLEKYGVSEEDLTRLQLGGPQTLYAFLHEKRAVWLERSSEARREQVVCAKALHDQTVKYQKNLRVATNCMSTVTALNKKDQKVAAAAAAECLSFLVERNRGQRNCRLVCLSDATSSMSKVWDTTLHTIREMLERVGTVSGSRGNIEVRWVAYRDYDCEGSSRSGLLESSDWTDDPASLVRFVSGIRCHGGADYEEAVEAGLQFVNNEDTPPTRVLLIGDAPPHKEVSGQKLGSHRDRVLATDYRKECAVLAAKGVKVFPFYLHDNAKTAFEEIARITGGAAEALSGSDSHALLDAVCLNALDDIGGLEMQQLYRAQYQ
ncbi:hypothetical protein CYMTET_35366 [Cymbomonas tetramitiformis]|uniref:chloroplast protein-transporting ATPase n=1 Tax=Cymbomonas tetramitiformis TaxID=36881 RepID=A0AAE0KP95_9CHLO|nr:hypothetical protein CYMTET_35366 [Cymbomonas tetramitiformis]